jgi:tRNA-guanine family transglycosylase
VYFKSPVDGKQLFIGPRESIKIQEDIGADIIFAFDECTSPVADYEYTKKSLEKTHTWAQIYKGYYGTIDENLQKLEYDLFYIKNRGPLIDLAITLRTINIVLRMKGR